MDAYRNIVKVLNNEWVENIFGPLTHQNIIDAMYSNDIVIHPYNQDQLTGVGYNLTPSELIISTKTGMPLKIYEENMETYILVPAHDTVLISTREYIRVSEKIMGTFHSKVRVVSSGFGHISTTLDPLWKGPLLISLNNPSAREIKLTLSKNKVFCSFITLVFYHLQTSYTTESDNPPNRTDILYEYMAKPSKLKMVVFAKTIQKYRDVIDRLSDCHEKVDTSKIKCPVLDAAEGLITNLMTTLNSPKNREETMKDIIALNIFVQKYREGNEVPYILFNMMERLSIALNNIDEIVKDYYDGDSSIFLDRVNYFFGCCLSAIHSEKVGRIWQEASAGKEARLHINNLSGPISRFIIGNSWRSIVWKIVLFVIIAILLFLSIQTDGISADNIYYGIAIILLAVLISNRK